MRQYALLWIMWTIVLGAAVYGFVRTGFGRKRVPHCRDCRPFTVKVVRFAPADEAK